MAGTIEYLTEALDNRDLRIEELEREAESLKTDLRGIREGWTRHTTIDERPLPVPRLEIEWTQDGGEDWYTRRATYRLVMRHLLGHLMSIPLGETKASGGDGMEPIHGGEIDLPLRHGAHIFHDMGAMGLPGFVILGDRIDKLDAAERGYGGQFAEGESHYKRDNGPAEPKPDMIAHLDREVERLEAAKRYTAAQVALQVANVELSNASRALDKLTFPADEETPDDIEDEEEAPSSY